MLDPIDFLYGLFKWTLTGAVGIFVLLFLILPAFGVVALMIALLVIG